MDINLFIDEIENFNNYIEPPSIKVIVGKSVLSIINQSNFEIINNVDIYKKFGHCAFLVKRQKTILNDSECCVWSLLLNLDTSVSKLLLQTIKTKNIEDKLINWLYYKHGIVMVNRQGYSKCFSIFKGKAISHVLIVSEYAHKTVLKFLKPNTFVSVVKHPSPKNWGFKDGSWYSRQDCFCMLANYRGHLFNKASLSDFVVVKK